MSTKWLGCLLVAGGWTAVASGQTMSARKAGMESDAPEPGWAYEFPALGAGEPSAPDLAWIPEGTFAMGNSYSNLYPSEGFAGELPVHDVSVSGFFIGRFEASNEEAARILQWAYTNGLVDVGPTVVTNIGPGETNIVTNLYGTVWNTEGTAKELVDLDAGTCQIAFTNGAFAVAAGKTNFPMIELTWHGAQAFCNYWSDREELERAVDFSPTNWTVDIDASGYRLPTEAEWEKASRGGTPGTHFPWPDDSVQGTNTYNWNIDPRKANYWDGWYGFTLTNHPGHPWFGEDVRTTPVGYYNGAQVITNWSTNRPYRGAGYGETNDMANGYGLYDMAGNVYEWCSDYLATNWYSQPEASLPDPTGPAMEASFFTQRVARGGGWTRYSVVVAPDPSFQRCSFRASFPAAYAAAFIGFRPARRPSAYEAWALGQGLDPLGTGGGADEDFDGDEYSNEKERITGTQPTNAASFFRAAGAGPVSNQAPVAFWAVSGRVYAVEGATNLADSSAWTPLATVTSMATGDADVPVDASAPQQFFRIRAWLAP